MLKCDFHVHASEPYETWYDVETMLKTMKRYGYDVIAVTNHDSTAPVEEAVRLGKKYDILVIPGIEKKINGKEIICLGNIVGVEKAKTFHELSKLKKRNNFLTIAPHPTYPPLGLTWRLHFLRDLIDAFEHCFFYTRLFNPNLITRFFAKLYSKPLIANSDMHTMIELDRNFTYIDAEKNQESIFDAIRNNKLKLVTSPMSWTMFTTHIRTLYRISKNLKSCKHKFFMS